MPWVKGFLWRCLWAAVLVIVILLVAPLVFAMVGISVTAGPAFALIRIVGALLILIYVFFGPDTHALF
jgi:hypothetical protein